MSKQEFRKLFEIALEEAAQNAEGKLKRAVPRNFQISLHGVGHSGDVVDLETGVDALYLSEDLFYGIIDLAVVEVNGQSTIVFARPSGHEPVPFDRTWNYTSGSGPFKQLIAEKIKVVQGQSY